MFAESLSLGTQLQDSGRDRVRDRQLRPGQVRRSQRGSPQDS